MVHIFSQIQPCSRIYEQSGRHSKAPNTQFYRKIVPKKIQLGTSLFWYGAPQILLPPQKEEDYLKSPIISVQMLLSFMVNCHLHFFMRSKATLLCDCIMAIPPQKVFVFGYQSAYISVSPLFVFRNDFNTMQNLEMGKELEIFILIRTYVCIFELRENLDYS